MAHLLEALDAFGDDLHAHVPGEIDQRLDDGLGSTGALAAMTPKTAATTFRLADLA
jgi:hypothetical protein